MVHSLKSSQPELSLHCGVFGDGAKLVKSVGVALCAVVGKVVGTLEKMLVGFTEGAPDEFIVGLAVGLSVDIKVGADVGATVGWIDGRSVGFFVMGTGVKASVGEKVGEDVVVPNSVMRVLDAKQTLIASMSSDDSKMKALPPYAQVTG